MGRALKEVRDALAQFTAEVDIKPGHEDERELTLPGDDDNYMEAAIAYKATSGTPGADVRSLFIIDDFRWLADQLFECLSGAIPMNLYMEQDSMDPMFLRKRINGIYSYEELTKTS